MTGLIAFFDILGYQSFLENNSAPEAAEKVLEMILTLPVQVKEKVKAHMLTQIPKEANPNVQSATSAIKHLIFSDTIVLLLPYPDGASQEWREIALANIAFASADLCQSLFAFGLPTRGALHEGEFILKEYCFAGTGIIDAYRLCSKLDFAGVVLSEPLAADLAKIQAKTRAFNTVTYDHFFVPIYSPLKGGAEKTLFHLNWVQSIQGENRLDLKSDVIQFVMRSFWAHKKDCPLSVDAKIRQTCKIMRRLMLACDEADKIWEKNLKQNVPAREEDPFASPPAE
jgi:hypothetical protein